MTVAIYDDHLLRDLLAGKPSRGLAHVIEGHEAATTNLYLYRLAKSVVSARGGALTGSWPPEARRALGRRLIDLPAEVHVVPIQTIAFRMAEIADSYQVSTLGAEVAAAAEYLNAAVYVWEGDDGPGIREAVTATGGAYHTIA